MNTILEQIQKEIKSYKEDTIEISPGVQFSQFKTLKKAYAYQNSKFTSGDTDPLTKKKKVFYQISRFRARVTAKMLDFDVKDIRVISNRIFDPIAQLKAYLLERKIKNWAKENVFTIVLNDIVQSVADFGSAVVKKPKGKPAEIKDLKYLYLDPSVDTIQDSAFVIEEQKLRRDEIDAKRDVWNNVQEVLDAFKDKDKITVYERYGIVEEKGKFNKKMIIITEAVGNHKDGIELFNESITDYPYQDFHINKINGRWLGVGTYEELFDAQMRENAIANQKARALELSSRQIYWTPDSLVARNILKDLDTGDILKTNSLNPLQTESRGLNEFQSEEARYDLLADRTTFTFDAVRGETLPATTPATNAVIQNQNAVAIFQQMRENLACQIIEFLTNLVVPDIIKESRGEHILKFIGKLSDLEKFDKMFTNHVVQQAAIKYLNKTGFYPEAGDIDNIKTKILSQLQESGMVRSVKIPEGFFSDISDIDILVDNESRDIPLQAQNLQALITMIMSNPAALDNPLVKSMIYSYAELLGISPVELEMAQNQQPLHQPNQQPINQQINAIKQNAQGGLPTPSSVQGLGVSAGNLAGLSQ